jgi:hypothetical protein
VQQPRRITGKLGKGFAQRISLFAGVLQTLEISCKVSCFSDKEEVPGSSPGRPTLINAHFAGKTRPKNEAGVYSSLVLSPLFFMESGQQ